MAEIEKKIKQTAFALGFDLAGITSADDIEKRQIDRYKAWLNARNNGQMAFLARNVENRFRPRSVLPWAESIICTAINYKIEQQESKNFLKIASYALYPDYHNFIRERLLLLAEFLGTIDKNLKFKICVDSSAVAEKPLAMRAGLGFIGRNRLLTNERFGSFLLLGEIITNLKLSTDEPVEKQQCGSCRKCINACPTGALTEDNFDARRCISYLTIEHKDESADELKNKTGGWLFGCDECLKACPFNEKSPICEKSQFGFVPRKTAVSADEIIGWTQNEFESFAKNSVIYRAGLDKIRRNASICQGL